MTIKQYFEEPEEFQKSINAVLRETTFPMDTADAYSCFLNYPLKDVSESEVKANPNYIFQLAFYTNRRLKQRAQNSSIAWPSELSKKESIICKLQMMEDQINIILSALDPGDVTRLVNGSVAGSIDPDVEDYVILAKSLKSFIRSVASELYAHKYIPGGDKWPGIDPRAALVLNSTNLCLKNSFKPIVNKNLVL
jgi:hypothetical protein